MFDVRLVFCLIGIEGDLFIGGVGLVFGYWCDLVKIVVSFIVYFGMGECFYCIGDRGCYLDDGNIEFLGCVDF